MHIEAYEWVKEQVKELDLTGKAVLEIGSLNVNGGVRPLFKRAARYLGIDLRNGVGVDRVLDLSAAPELLPPASFDIVVSTETLEHAERPAELLAGALRALKPGGLLLLTAASPERPPHSVDGDDVVPEGEHYAGIEPTQLKEWLQGWKSVKVSHDKKRGDVYAIAHKPADGATSQVEGSGPPAASATARAAAPKESGA